MDGDRFVHVAGHQKEQFLESIEKAISLVRPGKSGSTFHKASSLSSGVEKRVGTDLPVGLTDSGKKGGRLLWLLSK